MKKNYYNHIGHLFRIKKDSYLKIEECGQEAGKYLTFNTTNGIEDIYELTDTRNVFNRNRTWEYDSNPDKDVCNEKELGKVDLYDALAWGLGYIYTLEEFENLRTSGKWWK